MYKKLNIPLLNVETMHLKPRAVPDLGKRATVGGF